LIDKNTYKEVIFYDFYILVIECVKKSVFNQILTTKTYGKH